MTRDPYVAEKRHPIRIAVVAISSAAAILFCLHLTTWIAESLGYTERGRAWQAVYRLSDAMVEFRDKSARWPATLDELEKKDLLKHEGVSFTYDPVKHLITLPTMFRPTLVERICGQDGGEGNYGMNLDAKR